MAAARRPRRSATRWRELIVRQADSGLSVAGFCAQAQLSVASFYQWRSRLRMAAQADRLTHSRELSVPASAATSGGFVDLGVLGGADGGRFQVRLELGGGITLTLARG